MGWFGRGKVADQYIAVVPAGGINNSAGQHFHASALSRNVIVVTLVCCRVMLQLSTAFDCKYTVGWSSASLKISPCVAMQHDVRRVVTIDVQQ